MAEHDFGTPTYNLARGLHSWDSRSTKYNTGYNESTWGNA